MNTKFRFVALLIFTIVFSVGVAVCEFDVSSLLFMFWLGILVSRVRRLRRIAGSQPARTTVMWHGGVMILIVVLAWLAPVKQRDDLLQRRVHLTATTMTVAQLADEYREHRRSFPLRISFPVEGPLAERRVRFSSTVLPLQQFIAEMEEQTGCEHRLTAGCGNATSVLYGSVFNQLSFNPRSESDLAHD